MLKYEQIISYGHGFTIVLHFMTINVRFSLQMGVENSLLVVLLPKEVARKLKFW